MKQLAFTAALLLAATPALAARCPGDVAKIDAALAAGTTLSTADLAQVQTLRDEGAALHQSGDHSASVETLAQAKDMLGLE